MAGGRLWTPAEEAAVRAIPHHSRDGSYHRLARETGRTYAAISTRHYLLTARTRRNLAWSAADDAKLARLRGEGLTWKEIALRMKRTYRAVTTRWYRFHRAA